VFFLRYPRHAHVIRRSAVERKGRVWFGL